MSQRMSPICIKYLESERERETEMRTCSYCWVCALLCCGKDQTCPAESAIVNMLYRQGAAFNKLCSKSRCMSHWQAASAAEDTVSRFLCGAFSSWIMSERVTERETQTREHWLASRDFRFKQPICRGRACIQIAHAHTLARTRLQTCTAACM